MIHPSTELRHIDAQLGYGVFATTRLPRGTITYVWDPLEVEIRPDDPRLEEAALRDQIERYSYIDSRGTRIVSWDHAKYVNHCCQCNTMSTAYGFEIAVRDIEAGEQITDEYGMFNLPEPMKLVCSGGPCRGQVCGGDLVRLSDDWDRKIQGCSRGSRARRAATVAARRLRDRYPGGTLRAMGRRLPLRSRAQRDGRNHSGALRVTAQMAWASQRPL